MGDVKPRKGKLVLAESTTPQLPGAPDGGAPNSVTSQLSAVARPTANTAARQAETIHCLTEWEIRIDPSLSASAQTHHRMTSRKALLS